MATESKSLARRIAESLDGEIGIATADVWRTHWEEDTGIIRDHPAISGRILDAVIKRVKRMHASNRGILIDTAAFTHLPIGYFFGNTDECGKSGRNFMRDACVAAIISEILDMV